MRALEALSQAADLADQDNTSAARDRLREVLRSAAELAEEPAEEVDGLILSISAATGLRRLAADLHQVIKASRKVVPLPGVDVDDNEGAASVTAALRSAGCPDVPDGLAIPVGYVVTPSMVWTRGGRGEENVQRPVGHGLIAVVGRAVDVETGDVRLVLTWRYHARWVRETVPRAVALDGRKLIGLANMGCPVDGRSASAVATWLAMQEASISAAIAPASSMARPGWTPDLCSFLWGADCIAGDAVYTPPGPGEAQRAGAYCASGSLDDWKRQIWRPCKDHAAGLVILSAFVPPLLPILGLAGWTLDIGGATTTGKSTSANLAASVWGDPGVVTNKWPTTWAAARNLMEQSSGVPCILDDTKNVKGNTELVKSVLYSAAFGRSQTLGQPGGGTQRERAISTVVISTGEAPAAALCGDAQGATTRVLSMRSPPLPPGSTAVAGALNEDCRSIYGTAGPAVVRWLADNRDKWDSLRGSYRTFRDAIAAAASDDLEARASAYVAQLQVAAWVMAAALGAEVPDALITRAMDCVRDGAGDRDTPTAALLWCAGWWDARPGLVHGEAQQQREIIGWCYADGRRAWSESALRRALSDGGYMWQEVLSAWRDRKWIEVNEPGRFSLRISRGACETRPRAILWSDVAMKVL